MTVKKKGRIYGFFSTSVRKCADTRRGGSGVDIKLEIWWKLKVPKPDYMASMVVVVVVDVAHLTCEYVTCARTLSHGWSIWWILQGRKEGLGLGDQCQSISVADMRRHASSALHRIIGYLTVCVCGRGGGVGVGVRNQIPIYKGTIIQKSVVGAVWISGWRARVRYVYEYCFSLHIIESERAEREKLFGSEFERLVGGGFGSLWRWSIISTCSRGNALVLYICCIFICLYVVWIIIHKAATFQTRSLAVANAIILSS